MLSPWPWDDVTVQLNDASWRTSTSFHLLSTNTSRTQCATMSHPFSAHKGLLRPSGYAYGRFLESLPKPTIWECMDYANGPNANRTAQISYSESWKSFPRFQNCHLPMVVHHGIKRISALEPCASTMPGCMGRQLGGNGWTEETQENLRKSPENDRKSLSNPLSAWIPARSHNFASCVWTTVLSDPPLGETWARTCKMSSIRMVWADLL